MADCYTIISLYTQDQVIESSLNSMGPGYYDPEYGQGIVGVLYSPKQIGQAKTVDELISLIETGFIDEFWSSAKNEVGRVFDENDCELNQRPENRYFIDNIRETIQDINDLEIIAIKSYITEGDEVVDITYSYYVKEKKYVYADNSNVDCIYSDDWVADALCFDDEEDLIEEE